MTEKSETRDFRSCLVTEAKRHGLPKPAEGRGFQIFPSITNTFASQL